MNILAIRCSVGDISSIKADLLALQYYQETLEMEEGLHLLFLPSADDKRLQALQAPEGLETEYEVLHSEAAG